MPSAIEIQVACELRSSNQVAYGMNPCSAQKRLLQEHGHHDLWGKAIRGEMSTEPCKGPQEDISVVS